MYNVHCARSSQRKSSDNHISPSQWHELTRGFAQVLPTRFLGERDRVELITTKPCTVPLWLSTEWVVSSRVDYSSRGRRNDLRGSSANLQEACSAIICLSSRIFSLRSATQENLNLQLQQQSDILDELNSGITGKVDTNVTDLLRVYYSIALIFLKTVTT